MPNTPEHCKTVNEALESYNFDDIRKTLDYMYYIQRTADTLDIPWIEINGLNVNRTNRFDFNYN